MGLGRVGTFVSCGKKKSGSTKPNERRDFYRRELFRSGDGIFLLDRNPIWMTPKFPDSATKLVIAHTRSEMSSDSIELETIYIPLLNEGTPVVRPASGVRVGEFTFVVILTPEYNPTDEEWKFPPGSIVTCRKEVWSEGKEILVATEKY